MRVVILGGGISGLSAAWALHKKWPNANITLLEKEKTLGGVIQTEKKDSYFFEKGPRTFSYQRSPELLQLIQEVGLEKDLVFSDPKAKKRYIYNKGKLKNFSSLLLGCAPFLLKELFIRPCSKEESIYEFGNRRFGKKITELFLDPMTLGIYAGDIKKLSLSSCFPIFKTWEQTRGSVLKGLWQARKKKKGKDSLFTLKNGMGSLIEALRENLPIQIETQKTAEELLKNGVIAGGVFYPADTVVSALPLPSLVKLTKSEESFTSQSLWTVSVKVKKGSLKKRGYGYLVPSHQNGEVLGMIWDSFVFPSLYPKDFDLFTVMVKPLATEEAVKKAALNALSTHLQIQEAEMLSFYFAKEAIVQFEVGYQEKKKRFLLDLKRNFPHLLVTGNFLEGASVNATVDRAFSLVNFRP